MNKKFFAITNIVSGRELGRTMDHEELAVDHFRSAYRQLIAASPRLAHNDLRIHLSVDEDEAAEDCLTCLRGRPCLVHP